MRRDNVQGSEQSLREKLQIEINSNPLKIDRSVFKKTPEERLDVKKVIQQHRKEEKQAGIDPKRRMERVLLVTT